MKNEEKIFCGSAKIVPTKYGDLTKISLNKDDINRMVSYMESEDSNWINLVVKEKQNKQEGKPTHYLEVDTWRPEPKQAHTPKQQYNAKEEKDELPF